MPDSAVIPNDAPCHLTCLFREKLIERECRGNPARQTQRRLSMKKLPPEKRDEYLFVMSVIQTIAAIAAIMTTLAVFAGSVFGWKH